MIISELACKTIISPNKSIRKHKIDTITIHCMACNGSIEACGNTFSLKSKEASSNYGIGSDGRIACYVPEDYRSWCSSNRANDDRAITIEVANDGGQVTGYHASQQAVDALIRLLVDVCRRNGIKELLWQANKNLVGQISKQNMTVHRWFVAKACPGDYLYNLHGYIADSVNKALGYPVQPTSNFVWNNVDWAPVFDPQYYSDNYYDLKAAFGDDSKQLFQHFVMFGMKEARQAIGSFNVIAYKNRYEDLQKAFGDKLMSYYWHYCVCGKKEGRIAT